MTVPLVARRPRLAGAVVAAGLVVAGWTALATWWAPRVTPTVPEVVRQMWNDRSFYVPHLRTTLVEAAWGYVLGNVAAIVVAALVVLVRPLSTVLERIGVAVYCLPLLALGPILQIVAPGSAAKIVLAALACFYTTMVCCVVGLRSADPASIDVVSAAGGGRLRSFVAVRVPASLPALFAGLRIAAPAALLGAIVGEYLGGRRGLGVAMIQSQSSFDVARTWGLAAVMGLTVGVVYAAMGLLSRLLLPWAAGERPLAVLQLASGRASVASSALSIALSAGLLIVGWWGLLRAYDLNPYFAKSPADVWTFLTTTSDDRSNLWSAFGTTVVDTAVGFAIGLAAAVVVSAASVAWSAVNWVVTPSAVAMRSIPIIAMTPLIALIFGRDLDGRDRDRRTRHVLPHVRRPDDSDARGTWTGLRPDRRLRGVSRSRTRRRASALCVAIAVRGLQDRPPRRAQRRLVGGVAGDRQGSRQSHAAGDGIFAVFPGLVGLDDHRRRVGVRLRPRRDGRVTRRPAARHDASRLTVH